MLNASALNSLFVHNDCRVKSVRFSSVAVFLTAAMGKTILLFSARLTPAHENTSLVFSHRSAFLPDSDNR